MVVAIDGPAGAGKSTVARAVGAALEGFSYLDTGAMYRCVGLAALRTSRPARTVVGGLEISFGAGGEVLLGGEDVGGLIRTPEVSEAASKAAADGEVRRVLVGLQQRLLAAGDWVAEGRDIATVVAPGAAVKVFLTASPEERARRRAAELGADAAQILAEQTLRDERDTGHGRSVSEAAPGAEPLDTTGLTLDEVVAEVVARVRAVGGP